MLQPRLGSRRCASGGGSKMEVKWNFWSRLVIAALLVNANLVLCQDNERSSDFEVTRIKRDTVPENRDLTVLLLNDKRSGDFNTKIGRYHNVKPLIGLLTSTARTFIQDGVTTEYATQILGTTLDNGRIYAQLLTKSSLVLYNNPDNDDVAVKPTRIHSAFDGEWNVKQDLGLINPEKFTVKNTDYIQPSSKMAIVYASKPMDVKYWNTEMGLEHNNNQVEEPTGRRVQQYNEIPRFSENDAFNYLDSPSAQNEKKHEIIINPSVIESATPRQSKAHVLPVEVKFENLIDSINASKISKVKPDYDLPTFTIKNEFSPLFYYIDNLESKGVPQAQAQPSKLPKKIFGQKPESRPKKTFTYAGFADFTTVVGDTVIVFTPNTEVNQGRSAGIVDVNPSAKAIDKLATKITFLSADFPVPTATYKPGKQTVATKLPKVVEDRRSDKALYNNEENLKKVLYETDQMPDAISVQYNNGFDLNMDAIQPSESSLISAESTQLTEDLEVIPLQNYNSEATDPLMTLSPSATLVESQESHDATVTESNNPTSTDDNDLSAFEEVTEYQDNLSTTTEEDSNEETSEESLTTGSDDNDTGSQEMTCTNGIQPTSTMTTAYNTLTYLTTYFIPLEGTDTTTSIKSEVVVESNVGFLTNYACKSDIVIEPTAVNKEIKPTILINKEEQIDAKDFTGVKTASSTTTQKEVEEKPTTPSTSVEAPDIEIMDNKFGEPFLHVKDTKETKTTTTTVTEHSSTTAIESHIETTVTEEPEETTEKLSTPIDSEEYFEGENLNNTENEIDLIYKTLYTTYTYFTTFFQGSTSSIASHKSVVTNIVTSTLDLSQLDPSLLGAFDAGEIKPTSVGIGRPTEIFAINSIIDLIKNKDVLESVESERDYNSQTPTPSLSDEDVRSIQPDVVKTFYTTYTFFTTIYVGNDANICSRNEVYTNYVGSEELLPTKSNPLAIESTKKEFDFRNCKQVKQSEMPPTESSQEVKVDSRHIENIDKYHSYSSIVRPHTSEAPADASPVEVDMLFSVETSPLESENTYVTDVKSSSSKGDMKLIENNNVYDDQISSESNIDEIMPSPTLLLQTSYTTFTYFTTMYIGKDSSKIKSRLETITNLVTETLAPKKETEVEENNLPITYYTTFTYWTTLYKDKTTTITSREEIISNVVTPPAQSVATVSPIDTTPIDIVSALPPKNLEVKIKPSLLSDSLETEDEKATFYTTYTYFTTFYIGNTSQIRSSLETVTNIVDNTKDPINDNELARSIVKGPADKNLVIGVHEKPVVKSTVLKEDITPTKLPDVPTISSTVLSGTYIDNLYAEIKPDTPKELPKEESEKRILYSQVAVITGDSTIITSDNKVLKNDTTTTTEASTTILTPTPEVIESSVSEPPTIIEDKPEDEEEETDEGTNTRKKSRLSFSTKKPSFTPVIRPFASRGRPTFSPKRVALTSSATTITRSDFTPTITATPTLKSVKSSGFGASRKIPSSSLLGSASSGRRFTGRSSASSSFNSPSAIRASGSGFRNRQEIQPTSRRTGFRSSSVRSNSLDFVSRSSTRIRPTASSRLRAGRQSVSVSQPPIDDSVVNESETQQEFESSTEVQETSEPPAQKTTNPLSRFRRPPLARLPGTSVTPRSTTQSTTRKGSFGRGRGTTTTQRATTRSTSNPLFALRSRQRPNALFPKRGLFKQPEPQEEEEKDEQEINEEQGEELAESEEFEEDNDYESSDRKEQQVSTSTAAAPKRAPGAVQIKPFGFRRRTKRQVDYGTRKYNNFRRPGTRNTAARKVDPEPETEAPTTQKARVTNRFGGRSNLATSRQSTTSAPAKHVSTKPSRQPFIIRGESRTTAPTTVPSYRTRNSRPLSRTTTSSSRPKAPRLSTYNSQTERARSNSRNSGGRSRTRGNSRVTTRPRTANDYGSDKQNYYQPISDGKITVTHHIPSEVTIPVVMGKITEYKNVITAKPSIEVLLPHQYSTSLGPLGNQQLVLVSDSTELGENGATKLIKFVLQETPTSTVVFTPTTIRGRKTSYSHLVPSTVYNVEYVTSTIAPEINANVPLANLLLSQLLLGNPQQQQINPLLGLQGQGLIPQQPMAQTPVTELKTKTTTYVTTVTDARETVLPITFRGIEILTTIVDPTINVITATEYITETVVTTPTVYGGQQNFNSLLFLLQQQQQQQQQIVLQSANPLLGLGQKDLSILQNNNLLQNNQHSNSDIYNSPKPNVLDITSNEEYSEYSQENSAEDLRDAPPPPPRFIKNKPRPPKPSPPKLTSVVTLYVSGRTPGEFSTVLSTVVTDDTQTVRKREAIYFEDVVLPSDLPNLEVLFSSQSDNALENSLIDDEKENKSVESQVETQSLESILGEVSSRIKLNASPSYVVILASPSIMKDTTEIISEDIS